MVQVVHVVGPGGSGKSLLIRRLAVGYEAEGKRCAGVDQEVMTDRAQALAAYPKADIIFLEHCELNVSAGVDVQDLVIKLVRHA